MSETLFQRGDLVWCRTEQGMWQRGITTDVFVAPVTGREVVVVRGVGYYTDDVVPDTGETLPTMDAPEPQSLRA